MDGASAPHPGSNQPLEQPPGHAKAIDFADFDRQEPTASSAGRRDRPRVRISVTANLIYFSGVVGLNALLFVLLPLLLLPASAWWALLALPVALSTTVHWSLIHEATHGVLHPNRHVNTLLGRLLAVCFLCPYQVLRFGHLCHHALNGRPSDRPELFDGTRAPAWRARLVYYFRLLFGLYGAELICTLLAFLPRPVLGRVARSLAYGANSDSLRVPDVAERQFTAPAKLVQLRIDGMLILGLWGVALWLYGWWLPLFVGVLVLRGAIVSLMDNAPHYGEPLGDIRQGHDSRLGPALRALLMNANYHGTHHRHPTLPWAALPARFAADGAAFHGHYLTAPLKQLRGPRPMTTEEAATHAR